MSNELIQKLMEEKRQKEEEFRKTIEEKKPKIELLYDKVTNEVLENFLHDEKPTSFRQIKNRYFQTVLNTKLSLAIERYGKTEV